MKRKKTHVFSAGSRVKVKSADAVAAELDRIRRKHKKLTPRLTWQESRARRAVFHREFEWNDKTCGELYRDEQARNLIQSVRLLGADEEATHRAYVHVTVDGESVYEPLATVLETPELRQQALTDAIGYLAAAQRKLQDWEEFAKLAQSVTRVVRRVETERRKLETADA